jgi:uncharacterized protein
MSFQFILGLVLLGCIAGFLSSMVGIGGGIVIVPALVMGFGLSQHTAQGTTLAMLSLPVALLSAINYHKEGKVNWQFALIISIGFLLGSFFGSKLALGTDEKIIKRFFSVLMIVIACKLWMDTRK